MACTVALPEGPQPAERCKGSPRAWHGPLQLTTKQALPMQGLVRRGWLLPGVGGLSQAQAQPRGRGSASGAPGSQAQAIMPRPPTNSAPLRPAPPGRSWAAAAAPGANRVQLSSEARPLFSHACFEPPPWQRCPPSPPTIQPCSHAVSHSLSHSSAHSHQTLVASAPFTLSLADQHSFTLRPSAPAPHLTTCPLAALFYPFAAATFLSTPCSDCLHQPLLCTDAL